MSMFAISPDPEEMRKAQDRRNAAVTSSYLEMYETLEGMTSDQLQEVAGWLLHAMQDAGFGHHLTGIIYGMVRYVHGICGCSPADPNHKTEDHSNPNFLTGKEEVQTEVAAEDEPAEFVGPVEVSGPKVQIKNHRGQEEWLEVESALERYNLEWYERPIAGYSRALRSLRCRACKLEYVSIADRALEQPGPEGCMGCIQVAKNGGAEPEGF